MSGDEEESFLEKEKKRKTNIFIDMTLFFFPKPNYCKINSKKIIQIELRREERKPSSLLIHKEATFVHQFDLGLIIIFQQFLEFKDEIRKN